MDTIRTFETARFLPRFGVVGLETNNGRGTGEFTVEGQLGPAEAVVKQWAPTLIGKTVDEALREINAIHRIAFYHDGPHFQSGLAGLEIALWDLRGQQLGRPIYNMLGAPVRDWLRVYQWVGGNKPDPDKAREDARNAVQRGLRALKMNAIMPTESLDFSGEVRNAVKVMRAVREEVGPDIDVALDFHGRCEWNSAIQLAAALAEFNPIFYEEPLRPEFNMHLHAVRAAAPRVIIATGERMYQPAQFVHPDVQQNVGLFQPDIVHIGGISRGRKVAALAEISGKAISFHCPLSPVAFLACLQVAAMSDAACTLESAQRLHYNAFGQTTEDDPWLRPVARADHGVFAIEREGEQAGHMRIPPGPGLGVTFDWDEIRRAAKEAEGAPEWKDERMTLPDGSVRDW